MISILTPVRAKDALQVQWLHEAIASVHDQTYADWEMIVVNDHSPADLSALRAAWPKVRWLEAEAEGVSAARNQAAEAATSNLLLPLDADDKLIPSALAAWSKAWPGRGDAGILYSDVIMFGQDYAQVYLSPEYNFHTLLQATFMVVGCLHTKADWERVGGWRLDMTAGLEDWEYWIALGELGVCGKRLPEPLYWYRRHPTGRLAWLKANRDRWDKAYLAMRELHRATYDGRYPMGCCGGRAPKGAQRPRHGGVPQAPIVQDIPKTADGLVKMVYMGSRRGDFQLVSGVTRTRYRVPGQGQIVCVADNGIQGVRPEDVAWFRSVSQGRDFRIVEEPRTPPPMPTIAAVQKAPARQAAKAEPGNWTPVIMEGKPSAELEQPKAADEAQPAVVEAQPATGKARRRHSG